MDFLGSNSLKTRQPPEDFYIQAADYRINAYVTKLFDLFQVGV